LDRGVHLESLIFISILALIFIVPVGKGGDLPWAILIRQGVVVLMICLWIITAMRKKNPSFITLGLEAPMFVFLFLCFISYLHSNYRYSTQLEITNIIIYLSYLFVCVQILNRSRLFLILRAIVISCTIQATFAIVQRYIYGMDPPEVRGTFFNTNYAANFMLVGLNIAFLHFLWGQGKRGWLHWFTGVIGLVILWGIIVTGSRSVAIAMIFLACFHVINLGRRWIPALVVYFLILWIIPNPVGERLLQFRFSEASDVHPMERIEIWKQSARIMLDNPVLGVSLGNFEDHTYPYNFPVDRSVARYGMRFTTAHNGLLQIGAEMGIPGLLTILWILFVIFKKALMGFRIHRENDTSFYLYIASTSLLAIAIPGLMSDNISSPPVVLLGLTMTAFICHISRIDKGPSYIHPGKWMTFFEGNMAITPLCALFLVVILICFFPFFCLNPYLGDLHFKKARVDIEEGRLEGAENSIKKAIYYCPEQPYYYQALGKINLIKYERFPSEENINDAISNFSKAIDINPRQPDFSFDMAKALESVRGIAYRIEELKQKVIRYYGDAISLAPKNPFYPFNLAIFYLKVGHPQMAIEYLKRAIDLEPNFINAHYLLSRIYLKQNLREKAREEEMVLNSLLKRFEKYTPRSLYEKLLFMKPESFFGKSKIYGER